MNRFTISLLAVASMSLATVGYAAALIAVALITINLRMDVKELNEEDNR